MDKHIWIRSIFIYKQFAPFETCELIFHTEKEITPRLLKFVFTPS